MRAAIVAELDRLDFLTPKRELEAWLDDPEGYEKSHARRMIDKLCALAGEARKRGEVLPAAADYNRALAHAPDDPQLLRIVAGMNRAEARARLLRRAAMALLLMLGLGAAAFVVGRVVRARITADVPRPPASLVVSPPASSLAVLPPAPSASVTPSATAPPRMPLVLSGLPPKPVERTLSLDLTPSMGVTISVDGAPVRHVNTGDTLTLDGKAHALAFGCDVCAPAERDVPAGDKDDTIVVRLRIKQATLFIQADPDKTYQIVQHPDVTVRAGTNSVPMKSVREWVTVKQIESSAVVKVQLEAGKSVEAAF
jgi:hypothetical protein